MRLLFRTSKLISASFAQMSAYTSLRRPVLYVRRLVGVVCARVWTEQARRQWSAPHIFGRSPSPQLFLSTLPSHNTLVQNASLLLLCRYRSTLLVFRTRTCKVPAPIPECVLICARTLAVTHDFKRPARLASMCCRRWSSRDS